MRTIVAIFTVLAVVGVLFAVHHVTGERDAYYFAAFALAAVGAVIVRAQGRARGWW